MNEVKIEADITANTKNVAALVQEVKQMEARIDKLEDLVQRLSGALQNLQADVTNTKQLTAHVMGRGMGSTTE